MYLIEKLKLLTSCCSRVRVVVWCRLFFDCFSCLKRTLCDASFLVSRHTDFLFFACWHDNDWFTDLGLGHTGVILWPTAPGWPIILPLCSYTVSKGQLVSLAPFSGLSIMSVTTHYKDIMRFHSELAWLFDLTCCRSLSVSPLISPSLYVWVCFCVPACLCVFLRTLFSQWSQLF